MSEEQAQELFGGEIANHVAHFHALDSLLYRLARKADTMQKVEQFTVKVARQEVIAHQIDVHNLLVLQFNMCLNGAHIGKTLLPNLRIFRVLAVCKVVRSKSFLNLFNLFHVVRSKFQHLVSTHILAYVSHKRLYIERGIVAHIGNTLAHGRYPLALQLLLSGCQCF